MIVPKENMKTNIIIVALVERGRVWVIGRTIQSQTMQWRMIESSILTVAKTDSSPITASGEREDKALKGECRKIFDL